MGRSALAVWDAVSEIQTVNGMFGRLQSYQKQCVPRLLPATTANYSVTSLVM